MEKYFNNSVDFDNIFHRKDKFVNLPHNKNWVNTNTTSLPISASGYGIFDGRKLWITNSSNTGGAIDTLRSIDTLTNKVVDTISYSNTINPNGICFDGKNLWVAINGSTFFFKYDITTPSSSASAISDTSPQDCAYAGGLYVYLLAYGTTDSKVHRVNKMSNSLYQTYTTTGSQSTRIIYDNYYYVWLNSTTTGKIVRMSAATGAYAFMDLANANTSTTFATDGSFVWVSHGSQISKINPATLTISSGPTLSGSTIHDITFDGRNLWCIDTSGLITKINVKTNTIVTSFSASTYGKLVSDFDHVWVISSPILKFNKYYGEL